jgi:hypothetical protein
MRPFRRSKQKKTIILEDQKIVQINSKTWIEVATNVPDNVARDKYLKNLAERTPDTRNFKNDNFILNMDFFR